LYKICFCKDHQTDSKWQIFTVDLSEATSNMVLYIRLSLFPISISRIFSSWCLWKFHNDWIQHSNC